MHVALVSIGNCPSLALRNLLHVCEADPELRAAVSFGLHDYDIRKFRDARAQASQQWSFITGFDEAVRELTAARPDVLAFSCYLWNTELSLHLAHLVKRLLPECAVVLGGPDAGPRAAQLLGRHPEVDVVVEGDGEISFRELLRQWLDRRGTDLENVPGIWYRSGEQVAMNQPPVESFDLSLLDGVYDAEPPAQSEIGRWQWPHLLFETVRGCPYSCSFCMYGKTPMTGKDPERVVEELAGLLERGLMIEIVDPTFTTYRKRAKQILRGLGEREYSGRLYFEAYPDSIDEEMAALIAGARAACIGIGFQTLSREGLEAVSRRKNLERFERAVALLRQHDIRFYVDVIYGLPETTVTDFLATIDYLYSLDITQLVIYRLLGLPGSPMMDDVERHGLVFSQYPPYELLRSNAFSLDDIAFCERFQVAYQRIFGVLGQDELRRQADQLGGVSRVVERFMASQGADSGGGPEMREAVRDLVAEMTEATSSRASAH